MFFRIFFVDRQNENVVQAFDGALEICVVVVNRFGARQIEWIMAIAECILIAENLTFVRRFNNIARRGCDIVNF